MPWGNAADFILKMLILTGFNILIIGIYTILLLIRMRAKGVCCFTVLQEKQRISNLFLSVYIWGIFPIWLGLLVWLFLFYVMRFVLLKKNSARLQTLYELFEVSNQPYPVVRNLKQWRKVICFQPKISKRCEFQYGIADHLTGLVALIVLFLFGQISLSQSAIGLHLADGIIVATAIFILLGKLFFQLTYYNIASQYYLSTVFAFTLIALIGVTYYSIVLYVLLQG